MVVFSMITIYPFYYTLIYSLNDATDSALGGLFYFVRKFSMQNYISLFQSTEVLNAYLVSGARVVVGTIAATFFTAIWAFAMQKKHLMGRRFYYILIIIPMFFSGGLIPTYLLIKSLHLMNTFWVYIIPAFLDIWNMILIKSYLNTLPASVEESAQIDGANEIVIFIRIIIPMALPILACVALWSALAHWNAWFDSYIYTSNPKLQTIQLLIRKMIRREASVESVFKAPDMVQMMRKKLVTPRSMQAAATVVTILPILAAYPFLQKYFIKGIVLGSVRE